MNIFYRMDRSLIEGDFNITLEDEWLLMPGKLEPLMRALRIRDLDHLLSSMYAFPSAFITFTGWSYSSFLEARGKMAATFRDHLDPLTLELMENPKTQAMGAMLPERNSDED